MLLISSYYIKGGLTSFCAQTEKYKKKRNHIKKAHPKCIVLFDEFFSMRK